MDNNKRIAKNAFMLYIRMLVTMLVALYTSRVILKNLGIVNYGIHNVVSSVITLFLFLNGTLSEATQRFIVYEIGKKNLKRVNSFFINSVNLHAFIAILVIILCETAGLWLVNHKLDIPPDRQTAALWVYQISVVTAVISIISVPYNAVIISYEKMTAFAYISFIEVGLKLLIAYLISVVLWDKLIIYALLLCSVQFILRFIYYFYCSRTFEAARYSFTYDKSVFREMLGFASWYLLGYVALVTNNQGIKIILNMFFGPVINAAMGIAEQVQNALNSFRVNFQTAINPQITKQYAQENISGMHALIFSSTKFSFFIFWVLSLPLFLYTKPILHFWLNKTPEYTVTFIHLLIVVAFIQALGNPLSVAIGAIGRLRKITLIQCFFSLLVLPVSYVFLHKGYSFVTPLCLYISILSVNYIINIIFLQRNTGFPCIRFLRTVWLPIGWVAILSAGGGVLLFLHVNNDVVSIISNIVSNCLLIYVCGLTRSEKQFLRNFITRRKVCV